MRAAFGTFDAMSAEKPGSNGKMLGVVALLVLVAGGSFYFLKARKSSAPQQVASTFRCIRLRTEAVGSECNATPNGRR